MSYNKLTKKQLIEKCEERGLETTGLLKPAILQKLRLFEAQARNESGSGNDDEVDHGEENADDEDDVASSVSENSGAKYENGDSLELKLIRAEAEKARAEAEKARAEIDRMKMELELFRARQGPSHGGDPSLLPSSNASNRTSKLPAQGEQEDALTYFLNFEKIALLNDIAETHWARILPSLLNSNLKTHYARLPIEVCRDYQQTKHELLKSARMTARFYLEKFRSLNRTGSESYAQFLYKLKDVQKYYLEASNVLTIDNLKEVMVMEQFKNSLPTVVREFVEARRPKDSGEAAAYADTCYECTLESRSHKPHADQSSKQLNRRGNAGKFEINYQHSRTVPEQKPVATAAAAKPTATAASVPNSSGGGGDKKQHFAALNPGYTGCWTCGMTNHKSFQCNKTNKNEKPEVKHVVENDKMYAKQDAVDYEKQFVIPVFVNSKECRALRDSGSHLTLVSST
ncbi:MAG: SAP domain-containing protein, partial [Oscillospiraceae bacterium]